MVISKIKALRKISVVLVLMFSFSLFAPFASAEGSPYIGSYTASITAGSNGSVTVWFQITGLGTLDEIGAISVTIYENGTLVKTYTHTNTSGMMGYNTFIHGSSITYAGTAGKNYYSYVTYQAGKNGLWDNRGMMTNTVTAK